MGETDERGNEKFECLKTGCKRIIIGASYVKHLETASHRGVTKGMYICPQCGKPCVFPISDKYFSYSFAL